MKLYFYYLETSGIICEECEVIERRNIYRFEQRPEGIYDVYIRKEDIGKAIYHGFCFVALTEKNIKKAAVILREKMEHNIEKGKQLIAWTNETIGETKKTISMIDNIIETDNSNEKE